MASKGDNRIDRFLNALSRVIGDRVKYDTIGLELNFPQYELDGKWTNAGGKQTFYQFVNSGLGA